MTSKWLVFLGTWMGLVHVITSYIPRACSTSLTLCSPSTFIHSPDPILLPLHNIVSPNPELHQYYHHNSNTLWRADVATTHSGVIAAITPPRGILGSVGSSWLSSSSAFSCSSSSSGRMNPTTSPPLDTLLTPPQLPDGAQTSQVRSPAILRHRLGRQTSYVRPGTGNTALLQQRVQPACSPVLGHK